MNVSKLAMTNSWVANANAALKTVFDPETFPALARYQVRRLYRAQMYACLTGALSVPLARGTRNTLN